ncbi:hypothetical protein [Verrucomicrobium sp. BvORR034]|uniref:hypothetical protein n=1 Tax=Verrucomicrobium sp. BvORR034 TaxID=1396418 RepID=UPI000679256D|nr:hypothetical protein [Verrucomicrobium sp. BvORR034]
MNRFIKIKISAPKISMEALADKISGVRVDSKQGKGFVLDNATRKRVQATWFEKVVTERKLDNGIFGVEIVEEVQIVSFGLLFVGSAMDLVVLDPPSGKYRLHNVLRMLFEKGNFLMQPLAVEECVGKICSDDRWELIGIETDRQAVSTGIFMSMSVSGHGDLQRYVELALPSQKCEFKVAHLKAKMSGHSELRLAISKTGMVRFSKSVDERDIEMIAERLVVETKS